MNHLFTYQFEKLVPAEEREWINWANMVEHSLGHSLDGDLTEHGYSLDRAYSFFKLGAKWSEYVHEVKTRIQYKRNVNQN